MISQIISVMDYTKIEAGKDLVTQGDPATSFIVLMKGAATVMKDGEVVRKFGALDYLGESALDISGDNTRSATVIADTEVQALSLTRDRFLELLLSADAEETGMAGHLRSASSRAIEKRQSYRKVDRERRSSKVEIESRLEEEAAD